MTAQDYLTLLSSLLSILLGGGFVALWMSVGSKIAQAEFKATAAESLAVAAHAKYEVADGKITEYRVEMIGKMAILKTLVEGQSLGLSEAEKRLAKSIDEMGDRFDRMAERMDKVFERVVK